MRCDGDPPSKAVVTLRQKKMVQYSAKASVVRRARKYKTAVTIPGTMPEPHRHLKNEMRLPRRHAIAIL